MFAQNFFLKEGEGVILLLLNLLNVRPKDSLVSVNRENVKYEVPARGRVG
jgi:hypothetical protein